MENDKSLYLKRMKRHLLTCLLLLALGGRATAQRPTDKLDRGLLAVPSGSGYLVSWRLMGEEYYGTEFNLYRNGTKINTKPIATGNFLDTGGSATAQYQVAPVVNGTEQALSAAVTPWTQKDGNNNPYYEFPVAAVTDRNGQDATADYELNDISLGDVDGDGIVEFIVKRNSRVAYDRTTTARNHLLECYTLRGERLWWIDLGPNMLSGADEQRDIVFYDWDGDGKAEGLMRGADNMIIHTADGRQITIGNMSLDTRYEGIEYTSTGNEYLLYLEGATGRPYQIGPAAHPDYMVYPLPRGLDSDWGAGIVGHRSTKHYFGAPFLDGRKASIFLGRGAYTKHHFASFDVDPITHQITKRWEWKSDGLSGAWFGQGYHNYGIADVDMDGRDEIVFGSMVIDDNGKGLSTTGLGHGDAQHTRDFDPYRFGLEFFGCNETSPNMNYRNATTSEFYYRSVGTNDDGRALMGNFSDKYPGCLGKSVNTGMISSVADREIPDAPGIAFSDLNFRIFWDGDLRDEVLNSPGSNARDAKIEKPGVGRIFTSWGCSTNNSSKNNPGASADILGDWREEIVLRTSDNRALRIYATPHPTTFRLPTLWHDHQYRQAMVWQSIGYNQPPHVSYFVGELEGITLAPPPLTNTGRTEIMNGGIISTSHNGQHVMVSQNSDTQIQIGDGAAPDVATFNVPSWTQGNNDNAAILTTYYTCTVTGAGFSGKTRLVKQGEGKLILPATAMTHTAPTDVWNGTLQFDGQMPESALWLNRHTTLLSNGGQFRSIRADYNATIQPGGADNVGQISADTLRLGFGSRIVLDIMQDRNDRINAKVLNIETKQWEYGPKYLSPVIEFRLAGTLQDGTYDLGAIETLQSGLVSNITLEGLPAEKQTSLQLNDGRLRLHVSSLRQPTAITWNGTAGPVWDKASTLNFMLTDNLIQEMQLFVTGDDVRFDDNTQQYAVELKGALEPNSVTVDNANDYTFQGNGLLAGNMRLTKQGTGTLTMKNDNTFTGPVLISGGTVSVSALANDVQGYGALGAVRDKASDLVLENSGTILATANVTQGSPMTVRGTEGGVINTQSDYVANRPIQGSKLTKKGNAWLKLNVANTLLDTLSIQAGAVDMTTDNSLMPAKAVELCGGALNDANGNGSYSNYTYAVHVPQGKTGTWNLDSRATYRNRLTGSGTLTVNVQTTIQRTQLQGDWSQFTGTVNTATNSGANFPFDNSYGLPKAELNIAAGMTVVNGGGKTFSIGKLSGTGTLGGPAAYASGGNISQITWRLGNDERWSFAGRISGNCKVVKTGSGRIQLSNKENDFSGPISIESGELALTSGATLGTGTLTVSQNAQLNATGNSATTLTNSAYTIQGTLMLGTNIPATTGVLNFNDKNVTFGSNSTLVIGVRRAATETLTGGCAMGRIKRLTMNGTVDVRVSDSHTLAEGDSVVLWKAASVSGTPKLLSKVVDIDLQLAWDDTDLQRGILRVVKDATVGIQDLENVEAQPIEVVNAGGSVVLTLHTSLSDAQNQLQRSKLPGGIYLLRSAQRSLKVMKR